MGLVLSRKEETGVMIGDSIRVTVVEIRGDKVRLLFEAPPDVSIHREEVYAAIHGPVPGAGGETD